jgi:hypothetical protein
MKEETDPTQISQGSYESKIREIHERRQCLAQEDASLAREQQWLEEGLALFARPASEPENVQEIIPPRVVFENRRTKPTLRQAIVLVFKDAPPERAWKPSEVIEALEQRGWMPEARSGSQMVRNRLGSMIENGDLVRDALGNYSLDPAVRNTGLLRYERE